MRDHRLAGRRKMLVTALFCTLAVTACFAPNAAFAAPVITITGEFAEGAITNASKTHYTVSVQKHPQVEMSLSCAINDAPDSACDEDEALSCVDTDASNEVCTLNLTDKRLSHGPQSLKVVAATCYVFCDSGGNWTDEASATHTFTVDHQKPIVSISGAPAKGTPILAFPFLLSFVADEPVSYFCITKTTAFSGCTTPFDVASIGNGSNILGVKAVDTVGNTSAVATASFEADVFQPRTCPKGKSKKAKAKRAKCIKANAKAKQKWKKKHRLK